MRLILHLYVNSLVFFDKNANFLENHDIFTQHKKPLYTVYKGFLAFPAIPYLEPSGNYNSDDYVYKVLFAIPYLEPSGYYKYAFIIPLYSVFRNTHKSKSVQITIYAKFD